MATWSRRELRHRTVEFPVPASPPYGACWVEVEKAISAAIAELQSAGLLPPDATPADDALRIRPGDEEIVVYFEVEEPS